MAQYPSAAGTDANLFVAVNNLSCVLNGAHNASVTTITVNSTTGFPAAGYVTIGSEAIAYTSTDATHFLSCTRGADGTTAASHSDLDQVKHVVIAAHHNTLKDEIKAIEADLVASYTGGSTTIATTFAKYLKLIGGTMSGAIAMGTNKITGLGNGTAAQDAVAFSQLKVLQAPVLGTNVSPFTTTSSTFQTTNCTASITPTSASSRILVIATGQLRSARLDISGVYASLFRDSTNLGGGSGVNLGQLLGPVAGTVVQNFNIGQCMATIDSPGTTSAITYSVKIANSDNTTSVVWGNEGKTTMILVEVV